MFIVYFVQCILIKPPMEYRKTTLAISQPVASWILHSLPSMTSTNFRDEPSWRVWNINWQQTAPAPAFSVDRVSEWLSEWLSKWMSEPWSLPLPQSAHVAQLLTLHLSKSLTSGICSYCLSLVFQRSMAMFSWWRRLLGMIFMAPNFIHVIFHLWSSLGPFGSGIKSL